MFTRTTTRKLDFLTRPVASELHFKPDGHAQERSSLCTNVVHPRKTKLLKVRKIKKNTAKPTDFTVFCGDPLEIRTPDPLLKRQRCSIFSRQNVG